MKKLSIIIVNYNTANFIHECLASLGVLPRSWEVVIVDNASKEPFKLKNSISNIKIIVNKENLGFAQANNQAIKKTNSEYVLLLNPDTIVSTNAIDYMVKFMDQHESTGVSTCRVELPSSKIDDASHRGFPTPWNAFCYFSGLSYLFPKSLIFNGYHLGYRDLDSIHEIGACVGAFMMIRSSVGRVLNWLDEDFFWYGEDLDFCYRVKQIGKSVYYVPNVSITHFKGVSSGIKKQSEGISTADRKTKQIAQNARFDAMKIFYRKHYKPKYPSAIYYLVIFGISMIKIAKNGRL